MQVVNRVRLYARRHSKPAGYTYLALNVLSELSWIARGQKAVEGLGTRVALPAHETLGTGLQSVVAAPLSRLDAHWGEVVVPVVAACEVAGPVRVEVCSRVEVAALGVVDGREPVVS